ncbi:MAG: hypothetical protein AAB458_02975 [Patescibacteria group bacterium]
MKYFKILFAVSTFLVLPSLALATVVPVFDWVAAYNSTAVNHGTIKAVTVDSDGNVYAGAGFTGSGTDLDPSGGTDTFTSLGGRDAFITKFDTNGAYEWSKTWGGSATDDVYEVKVFPEGAIITVSAFQGTVDFDPGVGSSLATSTGSKDIALSFFDGDGTLTSFLAYGGTGEDSPIDVGLGEDVVYIYGSFEGTTDFDPGIGTAFGTSNGSIDYALSALSSDGAFQWVRTWGNAGFDIATRMYVSGVGDVFVMGAFSGTVDFDPSENTNSLASNGSYDQFISKFSSDGTYEWTAVAGGSGFEYPGQTTVDSDGGVYLMSQFLSTVDFDPGGGTALATSAGSSDVVLLKLTSEGDFVWVKTWGGTDEDIGNEVFIDEEGNLIAVGHFNGTVDFDPDVGTNSIASVGGRDVFINAFTTDGDYISTRTYGGSGSEWLDGAFLNDEKLSIVGVYQSAPTDFDPSVEVQNKSSDGNDMYLLSLDLEEASINFSNDDLSLHEGIADQATSYTLELSAPPVHDVTIAIDAGVDMTTDVSEITFASTTWDVPQTVVVSVVNDEEIEGTDTRTIIHTASSTDGAFDELTAQVSVEISDDDHDNDGSSSGGVRSSGGGSSGGDGEEEDDEPTLPTESVLPDQAAEIAQQLTERILELRAQLIELLTQRLEELRAQLAELLAEQGQ